MVVARKETLTYFGSPLALIFVGVFLSLTLFLFFWVDTFFARNIADVRPMFRWMPIVMIFLVATLTMRQWSEEQRVGTLEILLTLPVPRLHLVLGKLIAVMALIVLALALTVVLVFTVSLLGDLDWGPVLGGYLAAVLMASAYTAIGLFVSSRTQNQIVALIITVLICGILYAAGTGDVTEFAGGRLSTVLQAIGMGSRFQSIERGVIDLRDLVYYLSHDDLCATQRNVLGHETLGPWLANGHVSPQHHNGGGIGRRKLDNVEPFAFSSVKPACRLNLSEAVQFVRRH